MNHYFKQKKKIENLEKIEQVDQVMFDCTDASMETSPAALLHRITIRECLAREMGRIGKSHEDAIQVAKTFEDNWYHFVDEVLELEEDDLKAMGIPLRIYKLLLKEAPNNTTSEAAPVISLKKRSSQSAVQEASFGMKVAEPFQRFHVQNNVDISSALSQIFPGDSSSFNLLDRENVSVSERKSFKPARVTQKTRGRNYCLREEDISPKLRKQLENFYIFMTKLSYDSLEPPLRKVTADYYDKLVRLMLGWLQYEREHGESLRKGEKANLNHLFPNSQKNSCRIIFDYLQWLKDHREASPGFQCNVLRASVKLAKFIFHSQVVSGKEDKTYDDIPVIKALRRLHMDCGKEYAKYPRFASEELKWINWPDFLRCIDTLRQECTTSTPNGKPRVPQAIARSYQKYLIFAILACVPDRQRTIRELQLGKTLLKLTEGEFAGFWIIKHGPQDYKTGKTMGERPPLILSQSIAPYLEEFITKWRKELNPKHEFLFSKVNGDPMTIDSMHNTFVRTMFRLTGKCTNPHMVRDIVVTHARNSDASERQLEALAIYMGHSVQTQRSSYDRRTKAQKIAPALSLLQAMQTSYQPQSPKE